MKKKILAGMILLMSLPVFSQIQFEKGYFINNKNIRTDCLIKNSDWKYNPVEFVYKLNEEDTPKTLRIYDVKELNILNSTKYVRYTIEIDRSFQDLHNLSTKRAPLWSKETILLKVLVKGKANLYSYSEQNLKKFFYKLDQDVPEQLLYKIYDTGHYQTAKNLTYINQLFKNVNCGQKEISEIKSKVEYKENDLIKYFKEYNFCDNPAQPKEEVYQHNNGSFNFTVVAGVNMNSLSIENSSITSGNYDIDYGLKFGYVLGFETEYILPFNKNKWGVFVSPNYSNYNSDVELEVHNDTSQPFIIKTSAEIKKIEIPLGLRYYFFLNDSSKLFIDAGGFMTWFSNSRIQFNHREGLELEKSYGFFVGFGVRMKERYSLRFHYSPEDILNDYLYWKSSYNNLSLSFGYTF